MTGHESLTFELLNKAHDRQPFCCGVEPLDAYLKTRASQELRHHVAFPYVMTFNGEPRVRGFYTLSAASVLLDALPAKLAKVTRYEMAPAVLIGRLAVDWELRGQGYGGLLLIDALRRIVRSGDFAVMAVIVDAKESQAEKFYARFGFEFLEGQGGRMFVPFKTIKNL